MELLFPHLAHTEIVARQAARVSRQVSSWSFLADWTAAWISESAVLVHRTTLSLLLCKGMGTNYSRAWESTGKVWNLELCGPAWHWGKSKAMSCGVTQGTGIIRIHIFLSCALPRHNSNLVSSIPIKEFFHIDIVQVDPWCGDMN